VSMGGEHPGAALLERDDALSTLEAAFGAVVAGHGGVALVSGEAGIGKTSLVRAFVAAERRATRVLAGACDDRCAHVRRSPRGVRPRAARRVVPRRRGRPRPSAAPGAGRGAGRSHAPARVGAPERRGGRSARGRGGRRDGPARDHGRQPVLRPRGAGEWPGAHAGERARRGPRPWNRGSADRARFEKEYLLAVGRRR
jgi:hypothetical protein